MRFEIRIFAELDLSYFVFQESFGKKLEEKRFECENFFYKELEEDKLKWKQSSDQIIYDLM